jgi:hypothetical protein
MIIDRKFAVILLIPLLGLSIPAALHFRKLAKPELSAEEIELAGFSSQPVVVSKPGQPTLFSNLESPVRAPAAIAAATNKGAVNFPPGPIPVAAASAKQISSPAELEYAPEVSMIYSDGQTRTAIIDGHVVREGASLGSSKIIKIEKTRVLLRTSGKEIWLNMN